VSAISNLGFGILKRDRTFAQPLNLTVTLFLGLFHVCAIVALFVFSWKALALALCLWWVAGSLGIGMGYHRLLTHRGFKTPKWIEYLLTICGTLALQGGPISWVATHRIHHQNSDQPDDPHSPRDGGYWAHMGWIITGAAMHNNPTALLPYVPELRKDRFMLWISKWHWVPVGALALIILFVGGWRYLMWGIFLRTVVGLHATYLVNSASHMWGSRRFLTRDSSRNNVWVAILTFGGSASPGTSSYTQARRPRSAEPRKRVHRARFPANQHRTRPPPPALCRTNGHDRRRRPHRHRPSAGPGAAREVVVPGAD
jgi:fatty-acid desaturase